MFKKRKTKTAAEFLRMGHMKRLKLVKMKWTGFKIRRESTWHTALGR